MRIFVVDFWLVDELTSIALTEDEEGFASYWYFWDVEDEIVIEFIIFDHIW